MDDIGTFVKTGGSCKTESAVDGDGISRPGHWGIMMMKGNKLEPRIELLEIMVVLWGEVKVGWERLKRLHSHTVRCDEAGDGQRARAALRVDAALYKRL